MFPQADLPQGEGLPGIITQIIELFGIIMHNTTINQHQILTHQSGTLIPLMAGIRFSETVRGYH
jgi:hypothetical protein